MPKFWSYFSNTTNLPNETSSHFNEFKTAVEILYNDLAFHIPLINKLEKFRTDFTLKSSIYGETTVLNAFKLLVRATLLSQLPPYHTKTIDSFYEDAFRAFCNLDEVKNEDECSGCLRETAQCECANICNMFYDTNRYLIFFS